VGRQQAAEQHGVIGEPAGRDEVEGAAGRGVLGTPLATAGHAGHALGDRAFAVDAAPEHLEPDPPAARLAVDLPYILLEVSARPTRGRRWPGPAAEVEGAQPTPAGGCGRVGVDSQTGTIFHRVITAVHVPPGQLPLPE
jgi:hypothetical protein